MSDLINVLDKGYVKFVDAMGNDGLIAKSARISYGKNAPNKEADVKLIHFLMKHGHLSPFEMCKVCFKLKMPIFVARQFMRHRTGSYNEKSMRYSEAGMDFYVPSIVDAVARKIIEDSQRKSYKTYTELLEQGVTKELARTVLPVSIFTEFYFSMDLRNLFHMLKLRLAKGAQAEIKAYAVAILEILKEKFPIACEAFSAYELGNYEA